MFVEERMQGIIDELHDEGKVIVKELSKKFEVTEDCIRKDLKALEKQGILKRTYGGAVSVRKASENRSIGSRTDDDIECKERIATKVFDLIQEKETIFLDIASTNLVVAKRLAKGKKRMTVISNMLDIIKVLSKNQYIDVVGVGGVLNKELSGFVGSSTIGEISNYRVDKSFIGSCGVDLVDNSIMTFVVEDGNTKKAIIKASKSAYLVISQNKFHRDGVYKFADLYDFDSIIVDENPDAQTSYVLKQRNINVI